MSKLTSRQQEEKLKTLQGLYEKLSFLQKLLAKLKPVGVQPLVLRQAKKVIDEMNMLGLPVRINEGYRSWERQDQLYAQGRTMPGNIVTNARGGQSLHNYGVAIDFVFVREGYNAPESHWQTLGQVVRKNGFEWGGDWKGFVDRPHAQLLMGYTLADFQNGRVDYNNYL